MAAELERQEMRRRTLADVAHELRTPLSVLQIDLESIEDGLIQPDTETIDQPWLVATLRRLVEDLRILSLADAGELKLDLQPVDLNGIIEINVKRIEGSARDKDIQIIQNLTAGEQLARGDDQRLNRRC